MFLFSRAQTTARAMAKLPTLPVELITQIALTLQGPPPSHSSDEWTFEPPFLAFTFPSQDVLHLSMTCSELRTKCGGVLWRCLRLGRQEEDKAYAEELRRLLKDGGHVLEEVRHLQMLDVLPEQLRLVAECIKAMPHLTHYSHEQASPIPTVIASALVKSPTIEGLFLSNFAIESLPSLLPLAHKIRYLSLSGAILPIILPAMVPHAPISVGKMRRMKVSFTEGMNSPTLQEQREAFNEHVSAFLNKCCGHLVYLKIEQADGGASDLSEKMGRMSLKNTGKKDWLQRLLKTMKEKSGGKELPRFKLLRYLRLGPVAFTPAFKHLIGSAPALRSVDVSSDDAKALVGPAKGLDHLKSLYYLSNGFIAIGKPVSAFISSSDLTSLGLSGLRPSDLTPLFADTPPSCLASLHTLYLELVDPEPGATDMCISISDLQAITEASPRIASLTLLAGLWRMEPEILFSIVLTSLPHITSFRFNHSFGAAPKMVGFPNPDRRYPGGIPTIRSPTRDCGALIVPVGSSPEKEMKIRIQNDIADARKFFRARFLDYSKNARTLERIIWEVSREVTWTFKLEWPTTGKGKVRLTDETKIVIDRHC